MSKLGYSAHIRWVWDGKIHLYLEPILKMDRNRITEYSSWLGVVYIAVSVFSIAAQSILLVIMLLAGVIYYFSKERRNAGKIDSRLVWLSIPAVYLFSLFYGRDFIRGWNQWLNMVPLIVLSLYFFVFRAHLKKHYLVIGFITAVLVSVVGHVLLPVSLPGWIKGTIPISLFHTADQNSWIIWAAAILSIDYIDNKLIKVLLFLIFELALLYFGSIRLAAFAWIFYIIHCLSQKISIKELAVQLVTSFPIVIIISYTLFPSFNLTVSQVSEYSFKLKNEIVFSWYQFLKHPITGVGIGDYLHAMWNEYNDHNLTNPDKPFFQFFHLLVSTGLVGLWPLYMIWNTLRLDRIPAVMLTLFFLTCLLFFAPFTSQVSCSAFILPFLINRMDERI